MTSFVLQFVVKTLNEIEEGFIFDRHTPEASTERLRGVEIMLKHMLDQHRGDVVIEPQIDRELLGCQYLADLYTTVAKLRNANKQTAEPIQVQEPAKAEDRRKSDEQEKDWFQVECKCGENYTTALPAFFYRSQCKRCEQKVYVDRKRRVQTTEGPAWIMTNRYFVPRSDEPDGEQNLDSNTENSGQMKVPIGEYVASKN